MYQRVNIAHGTNEQDVEFPTLKFSSITKSDLKKSIFEQSENENTQTSARTRPKHKLHLSKKITIVNHREPLISLTTPKPCNCAYKTHSSTIILSCRTVNLSDRAIT